MRDLLSDLEHATPEEKDPVHRAQSAMQRDLPRRFYKTVGVEQLPEGFTVTLDGKPLRTPARGQFLLHSEALARLAAEEWDAQTTRVDPGAMPLTRIVNTALDGVAHTKDEVRQEMLAFAGSDLLCYRAGSPEDLAGRQSELWNPFLAWMEGSHGARFALAEGVMHVDQPEETVSIVAGLLAVHDSPLVLTALHVVTTITGSVVMALALANGQAEPEAVWTAAHVDEDWNIAQWGEDAEAARRRAARKREFDAAAALMTDVRG